MKKILISILSLVACSSAFATITDNAYGGKLITGDYTASELVQANGGSDTFANISLNGSISITDGTSITTTTTSLMGTSSDYTFVVQTGGSATLSLEKGSTGSFNIKEAMNSWRGPLTINVDKDAGGYICTNRVTSQNYAVTLNLDKAYAIRPSDSDTTFSITVVNSMTINATADQAIKIDLRSGSKLNLNVTNGANLYINKMMNNGSNKATITVNIQSSLEDGAILFDKDMVTSEFAYDETLGGFISIHNGNGVEEYVYGKSEFALSKGAKSELTGQDILEACEICKNGKYCQIYWVVRDEL